MKTSWILPDRAQTGTMLLDLGDTTEPLHKALSLAKLPRAFTLGIPEELFQPGREQRVFYMQYARLEAGDEAIFSASLEAGKDVGGRTVVLTLLVQLDAGEQIRPEFIKECYRPNSASDYAKEILNLVGGQLDDPNSSLREMLDAVRRFRHWKTFASEMLRRAANRPDWMKKKTSDLDSDYF
ncbi:hypothetical protein [Paraburkholderia sp. J67]|uniref:hypothetical protein n=1 Tax=Paraburkholderia sp. J67 TaxID=2805435 RepID=UPI002ABE29C9|nr:hypothetical protein [Paraburkholderia sp. J67]